MSPESWPRAAGSPPPGCATGPWSRPTTCSSPSAPHPTPASSTAAACAWPTGWSATSTSPPSPASGPPGTWPAGTTPCSAPTCAASTGPTPPSRAWPPPATCSTPNPPAPYFWSDQRGVRIQAYGRLPGHHEARVVEGDPAQGRLLVARRTGHRLTGALSFGMPPTALRLWCTVIAAGSDWRAAIATAPAARPHTP
ncbi:oxidoreductase C-terminal domain-containing protein [Streptomyces sp. NPDC092952]|uniref:oxidoreductase C-terminal domain-containing protein n=1 Tax=Streptomyces sp. NPDC092952 TaxID=3366018 RepID=UPI0038124558